MFFVLFFKTRLEESAVGRRHNMRRVDGLVSSTPSGVRKTFFFPPSSSAHPSADRWKNKSEMFPHVRIQNFFLENPSNFTALDTFSLRSYCLPPVCGAGGAKHDG